MMYKISMSNRESILTNKEMVDKLLANISSNFVILGDEIVNPSFIVSITKEFDIEENHHSIKKASKYKQIGHMDDARNSYVIDGYQDIETGEIVKCIEQ